MHMGAILEWLNFLATVDARLCEAQGLPSFYDWTNDVLKRYGGKPGKDVRGNYGAGRGAYHTAVFDDEDSALDYRARGPGQDEELLDYIEIDELDGKWAVMLPTEKLYRKVLGESIDEAMGSVAPGREHSTPFVVRCVASQVFGKGKSTRSKPNAKFLANPRGELDKYFARCVAMEKKSKNPLSKNALGRKGYKGREKQFDAALAIGREQTDKRRKSQGKATYGPSKGKKKTKWGKCSKKAAPESDTNENPIAAYFRKRQG